jgi:2-amino-4-hydroxy-6-hydroxymethyldihydropteridine diphosphokinase
MSKQIVFSLGGNVGNVEEIFKKAVQLLEINVGKLTLKSSLYVTKAWGVENQPDFLNQVLVFNSNLKAIDVLNEILLIEKQLGRDRTKQKKWEQRPIDIDILFYGNEIIDLPELIVPHPFIQNRKFILSPLLEVLPNFVHPLFNKTIQELFINCLDKLEVTKK